MVEQRGADVGVAPRSGPMQARATTVVMEIHGGTSMAQHEDHLGVPALACTEKRSVAVGVDSVQLGRVLEKELDTAGMTRESSCMQG